VRSFLAPLLSEPRRACALRNTRTGKLVVTHLEAAFDRKTRNRGLLGRPSLERDHALILAPCNAVHMFFMKFPIDVMFVGRDGTVRRIARELRPWRLAGSLRAYATIETAAGVVRSTDTRIGDVLSVEAAHGAPESGAAVSATLIE
jgi:uncharacterized protein